MKKVFVLLIILPLFLTGCVDSIKRAGQNLSEALGEYDDDPQASSDGQMSEEAEIYGSDTGTIEQNYDSAVERAKQIWIATATGDVQTLRDYTTEDFFDNQYGGYTDEEIREMLLSVPYERREKLIDHVSNHSTITTYPNSAGDVVTVEFLDDISGKIMTFQLVDETGDNDWKVFDYTY